MSQVFVTADLHLGHKNALRFRPQFSSIEEHDQTIISNYKQLVSKRDTIYFLGDIAFTTEAVELVKTLPGHKILVLGNHDTDRSNKLSTELMSCFKRVHAITSKSNCWLTHVPIHPVELRGRCNIHGHVHSNTVQDSRYANVSLENTDYKPVLFTDVLDHLVTNKETNSDRHFY